MSDEEYKPRQKPVLTKEQKLTYQKETVCHIKDLILEDRTGLDTKD